MPYRHGPIKSIARCNSKRNCWRKIMLKCVEEAARYVGIMGFRDVRVEEPDQLLNMLRREHKDVALQFFDANLIATWEHLYFAVVDALMAFKTKRNISRNLHIEIMLYASAQRQIQKAIELIGVKPGVVDVAVVGVNETSKAVEAALASISEHFCRIPNERVLELSSRKIQHIRQAFAITQDELAAVTNKCDTEHALVDLLIERMALLPTRL